jgi:hypothetical protein
MAPHAEIESLSEPSTEIVAVVILDVGKIEMSPRSLDESVYIRSDDIRYTRHTVVAHQAKVYRVRRFQEVRCGFSTPRESLDTRFGSVTTREVVLHAGMHHMTIRANKEIPIVIGAFSWRQHGVHRTPEFRVYPANVYLCAH